MPAANEGLHKTVCSHDCPDACSVLVTLRDGQAVRFRGDPDHQWDDPPLKFLYIHGSNPAATAPLQARLVEGLKREDLFTVVHERFMTDTGFAER